MPATLKDALDALKAALIELDPVGSDGFEGLLAELLNEITKQDFRLASSGSQGGQDGATLAGLNHLSFEGKLYTGSINKNEVLSKITALIASASPPDLWILGATIGLSTQVTDQIQQATMKNGIASLILDWPANSGVPPLAAFCAMAKTRTYDFLSRQLTDQTLVANAKAGLDRIASDAAFQPAQTAILDSLNPASLGVPVAVERNAAWLRKIFGNSKHARMALGQRLAPFEQGPVPTQARPVLVSSLQSNLSDARTERLLAILGDEGVGKSWLFAQTWQTSAPQPLTLIVPASDVEKESLTNFDRFLVGQIITQTTDTPSDYTNARWQKRLKRWRDLPTPGAPRIILCVDGLNQHSSFDWRRWLDGAALKLYELGGILVITDRTKHFDTRIKQVLLSDVTRLPVPPWTRDELTKILADKGIAAADLRNDVLDCLCNPRVLGIAFELLERRSIDSFKGLSVARLLFEHMRVGELDGTAAEPAAEFSKRLAQHAQEIVARAVRQEGGEARVFDISGDNRFELKPELVAVTAERYFRVLDDDPTRYEITDDGLSLALGLSLIDRLKMAKRLGDDLTEALARLLEPIAALDKTAEAVFNANLAANLSDCAPEISAALQAAYVRLQNVSDDNYATFAASLRVRPEATMLAIEFLGATPGHVARLDWLVEAMREARSSDPKMWPEMAVHLKRWLGRYSTAAQLRVHGSRADDAEKYDRDLAAAQTRLEELTATQTAAERTFVREHMTEDDADPSMLARVAIELLAGMPLADFAKSLVAWAYSNALNASFNSPGDEFANLIRFNRQDWEATRSALLAEAELLASPDTSRTGKWALVSLLGATATPDDSIRQAALIEELTGGERGESWRAIENLCSSDPCDPLSDEPENIASTAERFAAIDVAALNAHEGMTQDDHFFDDAMTGLARFRPDAALSTIRRLADSTAQREGRPLFLSLVELEPHTAALTGPNIETLSEVARTHQHPREEEGDRSDWISSQYALLLTFPHLQGEEQIAALAALPPGNSPILKLMEGTKRVEPSAVESALASVLFGNVEQKLGVLSFAARQDGSLTESARAFVAALLNDPDSAVRGEAMALAAQLDDEGLLRQIAASGWSASPRQQTEKAFELWHGSRAIIRAAKRGFLDADDAISRITVDALDMAAVELGADAATPIAARLTVALERTLEAEFVNPAPRAEQEIPFEPSHYPPMFSLSLEEDDTDNGPRRAFRRLEETPEDFERRQRRAWEIFSQFKAELTQQQARLIIDDVGKAAIAAAISSASSWGRDAAQTLLDAPAQKHHFVSNFGLRVARALSEREPALSRQLYDRMSGLNAVVSVTYGPAGIPLDAFCAWGGADNAEWDELRAARLDRASSDHEIATEVLAALHCGKPQYLERYVRERLARPEPVMIARALMVLGLGEPSTFADDKIAEHEKISGFLGEVASDARYAYERNVWARDWYQIMTSANSAEEFWRGSVLLRKIADGRFALWRQSNQRDGGPAALFEGSIDADIKRRIKKWRTKREKTLFRSKVPASVFVA